MDALITRLTKVRQAKSSIEDVVLQRRLGRGDTIKNYAAGVRVVREVQGFRYDLSNRSALLNTLQTEQNRLENELRTFIRQNTVIQQTQIMRNLLPEFRPLTLNDFRLFPNQETIVPIRDIIPLVITTTNNKRFTITIKSGLNPNITRVRTFNNANEFIEWINTANEIIEFDSENGELVQTTPFQNILQPTIEMVAGGCNNNVGEEKTRDFSNFRYTFTVEVNHSRYNNCGIDILRNELNLNKSALQVRKQYNIPANTPLTHEQMGAIYRGHREFKEDERHELRIYDIDSLGEIDRNYENNINIFYHKNHYFKIINIHDNRSDENGDPLTKQERDALDKNRSNLLFVDLETRPTEEYFLINKNSDNPTKSYILKDTITHVYYRKGNDKYHHQSFETNEISSARQFINWLNHESRNNRFYTIIAHNGGRFDFYFMVATMTENEILLNNIFHKGLSILKIEFNGHQFIDSCRHLMSSLDGLCKSYKVDVAKLNEVVVNGKTISTSQLCFYKPELTFSEFMNLRNTEPEFWNVYNEYCKIDCISLSQVWDAYDKSVRMIMRKLDDEKIQYYKNKCIDERCEPNCKKHIHTKLAKLYTAASKMTSSALALTMAKGILKSPEHTMVRTFYKSEGKFDEEKYKFISKHKRGGISHCHIPCKTDYVVGYDIKSSYPACIMNMRVPAGRSEWGTTYEPIKHGFYLVSRLEFEDGTPALKLVANVINEVLNWRTGNILEGEFYLDSFLVDYLFQNGLVNITVTRSLLSSSYIRSADVFGIYVKVLFREKELQDELKTSKHIDYNPAYREAVKLFLNGVTGKFVESTEDYKHRFYGFGKNKISNVAYVEVDKDKPKYNELMIYGVMIYSYSKRLLYEYMTFLPKKADSVIHTETDSIYFHGSLEQTFINNMDKYRGAFPCKIGTKLGNVEREKSIKSTCYFLWKKMYKIGDTMKIKGIPKTTILPDGTKIENMDETLFENLSQGLKQTVAYTTLQKNLCKSQISSHSTSRTVSCNAVRIMNADDFN